MISFRQLIQRPDRGLLALALLGLAACAGVPELPPADLQEPGWQTRSGQAVWQPADADPPRLIGDLLIATRGDERLINFVKPPIPLFTARVADGRWLIRFVERDRAYGGRGRPPEKRFIWFALPDILAGEPPPKPWQVEHQGEGRWRLENPKSGETVRLVLSP